MTAALCGSVTEENDNIEDGNKVVPESIDDYSSHWCEWALKKANTIGENVTVISVNIKRLSNDSNGLSNGEGLSDAPDGGGLSDAQIMRVELGYGGETIGTEPDSMIAKWFTNVSLKISLHWRILFRLMGEEYGAGLEENFYRSEIQFYNEILPLIKDTFAHPKLYYIGILDRGNRNYWNGVIRDKPCNVKSVVLMQDMKGWESKDVITNFLNGGLDISNAEASFKNVAVLHAAYWEKSVDNTTHSFVKPSNCEKELRGAAHAYHAAKSRNKMLSSTKICLRQINKFKTVWGGHEWMAVAKEVKMPSWFVADDLSNGKHPVLNDPSVQEMLSVLAQRYPAFNKSVASDYLKKPMQTLLHGDFHVGNNMYGVGKDKGKVVTFDFQGVGRGRVAVEVVYYFSMMPDVSNYMHLAKVYHNALVLCGVSKYSYGEFKQDIIIQMGELVVRLIMECVTISPSTMEKIWKMYGDKYNDMVKVFEMGAMAWSLVMVTDLYLKNKQGFLKEESFDDV